MPSEGLTDDKGRAKPENTPGMVYDDTILELEVEIREENGVVLISLEGIELHNNFFWNIGDINNTGVYPRLTKLVMKANGQEGTKQPSGPVYKITDDVEVSRIAEGSTYTVESLLFKDFEPYDKVVTEVTSETNSFTVSFDKEVREADDYKIVTLLKSGDKVLQVYNGNFDKRNR